MLSIRSLIIAPVAALVLSVSAFAADPSGTWTWTITGPNGKSIKQSMKLVLKEGSLTGTVTAPRVGEAPILDASFKGDTVKFSVNRVFGERTLTTKYEGKLSGDTITGTIDSPAMRRAGANGGGDGPRKLDWTAERSK